jgi:hypothetical protein
MQVEIGGEIIEFPEGMTEEQLHEAARAIYQQQQQELAAAAEAQPGRGERFLHGAMDPVVGAVQLIERANLSPTRFGSPQGADKFARDREAQYQERRGPDAGFDAARMGGNVASGLPLGFGFPQGATLPARMGWSGLAGLFGGSSMPVTGEDEDTFWRDKAIQGTVGTTTGMATPVVSGAGARVINPKAATNPDVRLLRKEGVRPTAAQVAGGAAKSV